MSSERTGPGGGSGTDSLADMPDPLLDPGWVRRVAPERLFSLQGQVALVTGAAGGVGRWLCAGFGLAGASVLATDVDEDGLRSLHAELTGLGIRTEILVADLTASDSPTHIVAETVRRLGAMDILVNNAGINRRLPMLEVDDELLAHIWKVDYLRAYQLSRAAAGVMVERGGGSIIHIGSVNSKVGLEDVSLLGPTKAALSQLAKVMTVELAHQGIRTNVLAPGFLDTTMNAGHWTDPARGPWIMDRVPMARPGHPAELVGAALLLASPAGSFLSGQTIHVDGGFTAGSRWNVPPGYGLKAYQAWRANGSPVREFPPRQDVD